MIRGVDVSAYQPVIDWAAVRAAGAEFAIVKVTDGNGYTNKYAKEQVKGALAHGMLVMLYHYAEPNGPNWLEDAAAEAKRLDELADSFEAELGQKFFCFLDVERNLPLTPAEKPRWREWCAEFRRWSREEGRRTIGWYSGKYFTTDLGIAGDWATTLLWLAQYPNVFRADANYGYWPKTIAPWWRADIWQDGGDYNHATWPGVAGACDCDVFAGTRQELQDLIDAAA